MKSFSKRRPEWRRIIGSSTSVEIPKDGISAIMPRMIEGLKSLGVTQKTKLDKSQQK